MSRCSSALLFAFVLALYLVPRVLMLETAFDEVAIPVYELSICGNLAKLLHEGGGALPLFDYYDNGGGQMLNGILAWPVYALFGDSYMSLKLVPLALGVGTLLLAWHFLRAHFGTLAAFLGCCLFALAPPTLFKYSLLAKGNHFENLFFQMLFLAGFYRLHTGDRRSRWLFWTSLAAGFAVFLYFGSLLMIAILALMHLCVRGVRASLSDLRLALPGFLLGLAPLLWIELASRGRATNFLQEKLLRDAPRELGGVFDRLGSFLTDVLPSSGAFPALGTIPGPVAGWMWLAVLCAAWILLLSVTVHRFRAAPGAGVEPTSEAERFERWKLAPFLLYPLLFLIAVGAGNFEFKPYPSPVEVGRYRYLVPGMFFGSLALAIATSRLFTARDLPRRALGAALAAVGLFCGAFTVSLADFTFRNTRVGERYAGYDWQEYAKLLFRERPERPQGFESLIAGLPPEARARVRSGIGQNLGWIWLPPGRAGAAEFRLGPLLDAWPEEARIDVARGFGAYLRGISSHPSFGLTGLSRILRELAQEDHPDLGRVVEGLAMENSYPLSMISSMYLKRMQVLELPCPARLRPALWRGLGLAFGRILARGIPVDRGALARGLSEASPDMRKELLHGVGWGAGEGFDELGLPHGLRALSRPEERSRLAEGLAGALLHLHGSDGAASRWRKAASVYPAVLPLEFPLPLSLDGNSPDPRIPRDPPPR